MSRTALDRDPSAPAMGDLGELAASLLERSEVPMPASTAPEAPSADAPPEPPRAGGDGASLTLAEVLGDANGEVVLANEAGLRSLSLEADSAVVAEGIAPAHVTAAGDDVSGFAYVTFESGMTLYYPPGLDLSLTTLA